MSQTKRAWNTPVTCRKCNTTISSSFPGEFVMCKCGAIMVDQTLHYERRMGNPHDFSDNEAFCEDATTEPTEKEETSQPSL